MVANYIAFSNAYQAGFAHLARVKNNSVTSGAPLGFPGIAGSWNTPSYFGTRDTKIEAFLTSDIVFSWGVEVFEFKPEVPLSSEASPLSEPVLVPVAVRGLSIPTDNYGMADDAVLVVPDDDDLFGTNIPAEKTRRVKQVTSDTFSPRYKAYAFVPTGPYAQSRLTGDLLGASCWVDDPDKLI